MVLFSNSGVNISGRNIWISQYYKDFCSKPVEPFAEFKTGISEFMKHLMSRTFSWNIKPDRLMDRRSLGSHVDRGVRRFRGHAGSLLLRLNGSRWVRSSSRTRKYKHRSGLVHGGRFSWFIFHWTCHAGGSVHLAGFGVKLWMTGSRMAWKRRAKGHQHSDGREWGSDGGIVVTVLHHKREPLSNW